ncbi:MAG: cyclic pyranopterin monophosphate synthase MoaC [Dehalococcoidia bacterium]|nr:cyclic pyranopterin monophosphate synthase MoaC [Dehalococcoidia bacterium]
MSEAGQIEIYTDGACLVNPGPGGWGAIVYGPSIPATWLAGHQPQTTNNRMEMTAVMRGLEHTPKGSLVRIYSDSTYVINTFTKNWQTKANLDLWEPFKRLVRERKVTWEWVRGHNGVPLNEEADRLATGAAADPAWGLMRQGPFGQAGAAAALASKPPQPALFDEPASTPTAAVPATPAVVAPPKLSHIDDTGHARMVDVSEKAVTGREATAKGAIYMDPATLALIQAGGVAKGDVFTVAQVAAVMAAKRTSDLIPLCHPLPLTHIDVRFEPDTAASCVHLTATVRTSAQTGVEMEALTAVSTAALTIYDMCKAVDRGMRIGDLRVTYKAGGKSGVFQQA